MRNDARLASVHFDLRLQVSAGHAEIQRRKLQRAVLYDQMRLHFLERQLFGHDFRTLESHIRIRGTQLFEAEWRARQYLVAGRRFRAWLASPIRADEAAQVLHVEFLRHHVRGDQLRLLATIHGEVSVHGRYAGRA